MGEVVGTDSWRRKGWPYLVLGAVAAVAVWHVVDFSEPKDPDFPKLVRSYFSRRPPAAYRLAEPGDTLDRVGLYLSAGALAVAALAVAIRARSRLPLSLWPTAVCLALAATWHASTPGPTFDGWHGLGWRAMADPAAPMPLRLALAAGALGLFCAIGANVRGCWPGRMGLIEQGRRRGILPLIVASFFLVGLRQYGFPGVEPVGYWPRACFDLGIVALASSLIRSGPLPGPGWKVASKVGLVAGWAVLVTGGIALTVYHRPLARLRPVVPGRIYMSAMPTYRGLEIEQKRLGFKTIINLFDEASSQASPRHEDEIRFVREHNLRYLGSPSDGMESDRFLDETLALAQDPEAWPILVHCHGCMDRTPAWMGLYRFLVEKKPLADALREIERHRGSRPKAVVTLQYNRKIPIRDPERYAADPAAQLLKANAATTRDPFVDPNWNRTATGRRVITRIDPDPSIRRP